MLGIDGYVPIDGICVPNADAGKVIDVIIVLNEMKKKKLYWLVVKCGGFILYTEDELDHLGLTYALTAHKLQGLYTLIGIVVFSFRNFTMLFR